MKETIIVLYENKGLTIQTTEVIQRGLLKLRSLAGYKKLIVEKKILNTDFMRMTVNLEPGRYQIQIITESETITKTINV